MITEGEPRNLPFPKLKTADLLEFSRNGSKERITQLVEDIGSPGNPEAFRILKLATDCVIDEMPRLGNQIELTPYIERMTTLLALFIAGVEHNGYKFNPTVSLETMYRENDHHYEKEYENFKKENEEFTGFAVGFMADFNVSEQCVMGPFVRLSIEQNLYGTVIEPSVNPS